MDNASQIYDTAVIGGGPAGLTAAIALAATGARTALLARRVPYADNRTTALLGASTDLLERLDVWSRCRDKAAALRTMRLADDTGRQSPARAAAGIGISRLDLHQSALTFNITHSRPHNGISTEFHTSQGPCVFVPLPGNRCSVVWVAATGEAERLMSLSDDELSEAAERQSHSILGRVQVEAGRNVFPLTIERPDQFASHRVALVG